LFGNKPGELFVFDVQAHSLKDGSIITATNVDGDGNGTKTANENLVEGGQLSFLVSPGAKLVQTTTTSTGTSANDTIEAGSTKGFDGVNDTVFTDGGNDLVDASIGGGSNRIYGGDGNDELYAGKNDRLFGEAGNDILDASPGKGGNRLYGGAGNDTLFAGSNDFLSGGDGNDILYAGKGGSTLYGDSGSDKFYLAYNGTPTSTNTVANFEVGIDKLLILGISGVTDFSKVTLTQKGADTLVAAGGKDLALLTGIQSSTLTTSSFTFT
jgi:serralysin